jgi:hypothetical protein
VLGIRDIQKKGFGKEEDNPNLRVRNALRRPVRGGWIESVERGTYKLTASGRRRAKDVGDKPSAPADARGARVDVEPGTKAVTAAAAPKKAAAKANGHAKGNGKSTTSKYPSQYVSAVTDVDPELSGEAFKVGILIAAANKVGLSDSKISKETTLSRGFVIPRVKKLKENKVDVGKALASSAALSAAIDMAQGVEV